MQNPPNDNTNKSQKIIRLGLPNLSQSKPPIVEFDNGSWKIWTAYNSKMDEGTYIILDRFGSMEKVTIYPDGTIASAKI